VDPIVEAAAYFLVAEALTNTRKHARAEAVTLSAGVRRDVLRVAVHDDGVGDARALPGSGLEGMRDRIEAVGGTLRIESPAGVGTRIVAEIPVSRDGAPPTPR
jgi:signal transduction histidine kinase